MNNIKVWPYFSQLDDLISDFLDKPNHKGLNISYVVWGGVAIETMLGIFGLIESHYSIHDVELFFTQSGEIVKCEKLYNSFRDEFLSHSRLHLRVGGIPIIMRVPATSVQSFQSQRFARHDGDLLINSIALEIDRVHDLVNISANCGTVGHHMQHGVELTVKDDRDLLAPVQIFRRVSRNISKAIRLQKFAGYQTGTRLVQAVERLTARYFICINDENLTILQSGTQLWTEIIAESAKRLAAFYRCTSLNRDDFGKYINGDFEEILCDPLVVAFEDTAILWGWKKPKLSGEIVDYCFSSYESYKI